MRRLFLLLIVLVTAANAQNTVTLLQDSMTGTAGTNLTAHTPNVGGTWAQLNSCGSMVLDGNGYSYQAVGAVTVINVNGVVPVQNTQITITSSIKLSSASDAQYSGPVLFSTTGIQWGYRVVPVNSGAGASYFIIQKGYMNGGCTLSVQGTVAQSPTTLTLNTTYPYVVTWGINSSGTTSQMTLVITQNGSTIWNSGTVTDTSAAAAANTVGVTSYSAGGTSTGTHVGNITATYGQNNGMYIGGNGMLLPGSTGNTLNVTGYGTTWTSGTVFSASSGTITNTVFNNAGSVTLTYTAPATSAATMTFSNSSDAYTAQLVTQMLVTDPGFYFSPGNWQQASPTSIASNAAGSYFYLNFTGTSLTLLMNGATMAVSYSRCTLDSGAFTDTSLSGLTYITIGAGLSNTAHTVVCYFRQRSWSTDTWNANPPTGSWIVNGAQLSPGASTSAPAVRPKTCLMLGASRDEGYSNFASGGGQDSTSSYAFAVANALNCEMSLAAYASQGLLAGGQTNVPPIPSTWNYKYSGTPRTVSGYDYIVDMEVTANDYYNGQPIATVQTAIVNLLTAQRAANSHAKLIWVPNVDGWWNDIDQTGFNNYVTASHDGNAYFIPNTLTARQKGALNNTTIPSFMAGDGRHPTSNYGDAVVGAAITYSLNRTLAVPVLMIPAL